MHTCSGHSRLWCCSNLIYQRFYRNSTLPKEACSWTVFTSGSTAFSFQQTHFEYSSISLSRAWRPWATKSASMFSIKYGELSSSSKPRRICIADCLRRLERSRRLTNPFYWSSFTLISDDDWESALMVGSSLNIFLALIVSYDLFF